MRIRLVAALLLSGVTFGAAAPIAAQGVSLWLDGGAAYARPPTGAPVEAGDYGTLSALLLAAPATALTADVTGYGGWSLRSAGGDWFGAEAGLTVRSRPAPLSAGGRFEASGLRYRSPFRYSTARVAVRPYVAGTLAGWAARLELTLSRGTWSGEAVSESGSPPGPPAPDTMVSGDLSMTGGAIELERRLGPFTLSLQPELYDSRNGEAPGTYGGGEVGIAWEHGSLSARAGAGAWSTPGVDTKHETEGVYDVSVLAEVGRGLTARLSAGREARDPLYGAPGTFGIELGLTWKVPLPAPAPPAPVAAVGRETAGGRAIRFHLALAADRVELAGDFNDWTPEPMHREGDAWVLEKVLRPGLYHFAFRVDGERWMVPQGAPGITDDGWGRPTASIVIEEM